MKKVLFSDFDGTLHINEHNMEDNIKAINEFRKNNNLFVIATGRSLEDLSSELIKYEIPYDYLLLNNGAVILDKNNEVLKTSFINKDICKQLINEVEKYEGKIEKIKLFGTISEDIKIDEEEITKIRIFTKTYKDTIELNEYIKKNIKGIKGYAVDAFEFKFVELITNNIDKSIAINYVLEKEKISKENTYTIGDDINDMRMIQDYNGSTVTSGNVRLKDVTNNIYDTVNEYIYVIMQGR